MNLSQPDDKRKGRKRRSSTPLTPMKANKLSDNQNSTNVEDSKPKRKHGAQSIQSSMSHKNQSSIPKHNLTQAQDMETENVDKANQTAEIQHIKKNPLAEKEDEENTTSVMDWDILKDFATLTDTISKDSLRQWMAGIFDYLKEPVLIRYSKKQSLEDEDVRQIYNYVMGKGLCDINLIYPNFDQNDILIEYGLDSAPLKSFRDSLTKEMLLNTIVLSVKNPQKKREIKNKKRKKANYYPVFLTRVMTASFNEELDLLSDLFQALKEKATVEKLYGLLVTQKDVRFIKYTGNAGAKTKLEISHVFPTYFKDCQKKEIQGLKQFEETLLLIGCILITAIKECRESFK